MSHKRSLRTHISIAACILIYSSSIYHTIYLYIYIYIACVWMWDCTCVCDVIIIVILYAIDKYNTHAHVRKAGLFNLWETISLNGTNRGHSEGLGVGRARVVAETWSEHVHKTSSVSFRSKPNNHSYQWLEISPEKTFASQKPVPNTIREHVCSHRAWSKLWTKTWII